MKISVFGTGYVGAVSLACLARDGHEVIGVDSDRVKLDLIAAGTSPVAEEGMPDLVRDVVASGRVQVTTDFTAAVLATEISFVCVGTPAAADGGQDLSSVERVCEQLGTALARKDAAHVVAFRSTLLPGTLEGVLRPIVERVSGKRDGSDFFLCVVPEFLREGSSIRDYDAPPFTVVGATHAAAADRLRALFGHLRCSFIATSVGNAEMVKYCCNNFHALKIAFANETARLCHALELDPFEVMSLVCQDKQLNISDAYLEPGFAFGGSCLPKDLRATGALARSVGVQIPMLDAILPSNEAHVALAFDRIMRSGLRRVGFVGLTFKPGTDDMRESPLVLLAERLIGQGLAIAIYEPDVQPSRLIGANRVFAGQHLPHLAELLRDDLAGLIRDSDILVVSRNDSRVIDALAGSDASGKLVLTLVRLPDREHLAARVEGLCW